MVTTTDIIIIIYLERCSASPLDLPQDSPITVCSDDNKMLTFLSWLASSLRGLCQALWQKSCVTLILK